MEKPKNNNYYFTQGTEDAIVRYNNTSDPVLRDRIFTKEIYYPFYKLVENIIHTFKFYYTDVHDIEDLKLEIISILVEEKIHRFDPTNGAKAFSYFQTIALKFYYFSHLKQRPYLSQSIQGSQRTYLEELS